ncbi:Stk1 family PASTA domain-containing Ser/Thr kinase [Paenibacillus sambharensis]|uniref:Serine/threonine-protein kinase PrkC n=1 Tax=Paenibacillus sambharensis TaxID=1803190 RepID=A0A2W1L2F6_9BACL|nr:Stk1 family PASTA domain-containing Ser/Thr kinase [Paenibacillus sambharensis]PZD93253.1 Stk1 family PASTA domain-containing Ser/Thr kinase [Paenibacillus sambharensis]
MIGHDLGGRYEILERIGGGGMALVYKAHDVLLSRNVAVKILRQQFVHDEEFVRRFRREAQSAASLSHPNVVSVYDVGQEDETHYIVMEYVEGSNLNEVIQERAPLQAEEAVRIALQICDALEHAHQNQIIHRDIKPHNILIGKNGRVKVTDFGIARAVTSSTITQTGSVVGSVHYFSPEHAKGVSTGEKSDLYSLGIVLYQMLTGRLPFLGESPISVALKHLQEDFEEPRAVNPHIPQSVENIVVRSMRKNPGERYSSAREMLNDLETCLLPERLHEPKITFDFDMDETRVMPAIRASAASGSTASASGSPSKGTPSGKADSVTGPNTKQGKKWVKPTVTVAVTLLVLAAVFFGVRTVLGILDPGEVDVPYVVGMQEEEAVRVLTEAGLKIEEPIVYESRPDIEPHTVFDQNKSNMKVKQGSYIKLFVSTGPDMEVMEDFSSRKVDEAVQALMDLNMTREQIKTNEVFNESDPGTIIGQSIPAGQEFNPLESSITFTVSKGEETFKMPSLLGMDEQKARNELQKHGLKLGPDSGIVTEGSYKGDGKVIDQFPYKPGDDVAKGSEVTLTISSGLPSDAVKYTFNIAISPAIAGEPSKVRIVYSDARGDNVESIQRTIEDTQTFPVDVVLAPNGEAVVRVYRDGQFADSFTVTYDEAKSGGSSKPQSVPGQQVEPPVTSEPPAEEQTGEEPPADKPAQTETQSEEDGGESDEQQPE